MKVRPVAVVAVTAGLIVTLPSVPAAQAQENINQLAAASTVQPATGMYALEAMALGASSGATCIVGGTPGTPWGITFSHLYYGGSAATSTAYVTNNFTGGSLYWGYQYGSGILPTPGNPVLVTFPQATASGIGTWKGSMTWNKNPWTVTPPGVTTTFSLTASIVDKHTFVFTITFATPIGAGSPPSCTEVVAYTAVKT